MDISKVVKGLEGALSVVEALTPLAGTVTQAGQIINFANTAAAIGRNVLTRIEEGKVVANSREKAAIDAIVTQLADVNDKLADRIANP